MERLGEMWRRLMFLILRRRFDRELEEEMRFHLEMKARAYVETKTDTEEARHAARRQFGNPTLLTEKSREMWGWAPFERLGQDLRYAVRMLVQSPGFAAAAVLSLALGIGANTAVFSLLNAVVLRPLPVPDPGSLVQFTCSLPMWDTGAAAPNTLFGYPQLERFQAESEALSGTIGLTGLGRVNLTHGGTAAAARADACSGNFFAVLQVRPQYGRLFSETDDRPNAFVAVISDRCWRNRFGADPRIAGSAVTINQIPFTVIGVTPPGFFDIAVGSSPDVWVPLRALDRLRPDSRRWKDPFASWLLIAGRLRPGISREHAEAGLDMAHRRLLEEYLPASEARSRESVRRFVKEGRVVLRSAATGVEGGLRRRYAFPLRLLMCVAGIVLLVTCANLANLLLARASSRRREFALRFALGAGRGRLVRQLLTESMVLAAAGGALAAGPALWGAAALVRIISGGDSPAPLDVRPDWTFLGFTTMVSLATGILFGMAPALRATSVDPGPATKEGAHQAGRSSHVLDRVLVVAQIALSVVLITGAGLFIRTLQKLRSVDTGYEGRNVLMFSVDARLAGYGSDRAGTVYREILRKLQSLPDVVSASASIVRPADDSFHLADQVGELDGRRLDERDAFRVNWNATSPGYFSTIYMPILAGRDFHLRDDENAPRVVILSQSLARRAFPNQSPIGHRVEGATVVGVVKDSPYGGPRDESKVVVYHPLFQHGRDQEYRWGFVSFELRYRSQSGLLEQVRREVASVDRNLPVFGAMTLQAQVDKLLVKERLLAMLSTFFGSLGALLVCLGLYGLMAYAVARRTAEIGIRMALGAGREHVIRLVVRETVSLAFMGFATGVPLALFAARYTKSLLFGIAPADPLTIAGTIGTLTAVAVLAGYMPARRAARIDPAEALRHE